MSKIICNIEESSCTPSSTPTITGSYVRCNIDDASCVPNTPTEGGGGAAPTYNLSGPSSINESESGVFTVSTTGVDEGLLIPYTLTGVQSADVLGGSLTGTFEIDANGAGSVTIQMVDDFVAEGETMVMTIGSALNPLDFINVSIVDSTYSLTASPAQIMEEGDSLSFNLTTTGVSDGQNRNWDITGSGHSLSATSGTFTVNSNAASVSISSVYDAVYQGTSNFTFRVFGSDGVTVGDTINFTVTDAASTYSQSSASAFDEGTSLAVTVSTTNVQDATTLYWTVNHGTTATADFTAESGSFTVTSNSGSFNVDAVADTTTEGAETFTIEIRTGSITGTIVNTSSTITINDTSTTSTFSNLYKLEGVPYYSVEGVYSEASNGGFFSTGATFDDINTTTRKTFNFWFYKPSTYSGEACYISDFFGTNGLGGHYALISRPNTFDIGFAINSGGSWRQTGIDLPSGFEDTWIMVTVIPDPNPPNTKFLLQNSTTFNSTYIWATYYQGVMNYVTTSNTITRASVFGARVYNGALYPTSSSGFSSNTFAIDDFTAWDKVLSTSEIQELHNSFVPYDYTTHSASSNLYRYVRFGDVTGDSESSIKCQIDNTFVLDKNGSASGTYINSLTSSEAPYVP